MRLPARAGRRWDQLDQQGWLTAVSPASVTVCGTWAMRRD